LPMISNVRISNTDNPEWPLQDEPATQSKKERSTSQIDLEKKKVYRVPM
jgi:hypothetical protein